MKQDWGSKNQFIVHKPVQYQPNMKSHLCLPDSSTIIIRKLIAELYWVGNTQLIIHKPVQYQPNNAISSMSTR
jgi:hypothetical protein